MHLPFGQHSKVCVPRVITNQMPMLQLEVKAGVNAGDAIMRMCTSLLHT